ncbi:eukaryotic translation initiation factor eIF-4G [Pelomyxa schiedti]|nr:eukaryotic translation initiation factor eIF-4G [Pelomyxa schiedti]
MWVFDEEDTSGGSSNNDNESNSDECGDDVVGQQQAPATAADARSRSRTRSSRCGACTGGRARLDRVVVDGVVEQCAAKTTVWWHFVNAGQQQATNNRVLQMSGGSSSSPGAGAGAGASGGGSRRRRLPSPPPTHRLCGGIPEAVASGGGEAAATPLDQQEKERDKLQQLQQQLQQIAQLHAQKQNLEQPMQQQQPQQLPEEGGESSDHQYDGDDENDGNADNESGGDCPGGSGAAKLRRSPTHGLSSVARKKRKRTDRNRLTKVRARFPRGIMGRVTAGSAVVDDHAEIFAKVIPVPKPCDTTSSSSEMACPTIRKDYPQGCYAFDLEVTSKWKRISIKLEFLHDIPLQGNAARLVLPNYLLPPRHVFQSSSLSYLIGMSSEILQVTSPTHHITSVTYETPMLTRAAFDLKEGYKESPTDLVVLVYSAMPLSTRLLYQPMPVPKLTASPTSTVAPVLIKLHPIFNCRQKIPEGEVLFIVDCGQTEEVLSLAQSSLLLFLSLMRMISTSTPFNIFCSTPDHPIVSCFNCPTQSSEDALKIAAQFLQYLHSSPTQASESLSVHLLPELRRGLRQIVYITGGKRTADLSQTFSNLRQTSRSHTRLLILFIGDDCDFPTYSELASCGSGALEHVISGTELEGCVSRQFSRLAHVVLSDVTLSWECNDPTVDLSPMSGPYNKPIYDGEQINLFTEFKHPIPSELRVSVKASGVGGPYTYSSTVQIACLEGTLLGQYSTMMKLLDSAKQGTSFTPVLSADGDNLKDSPILTENHTMVAHLTTSTHTVFKLNGSLIPYSYSQPQTAPLEEHGVDESQDSNKRSYSLDFLMSFKPTYTNKPAGLTVTIEKLFFSGDHQGIYEQRENERSRDWKHSSWDGARNRHNDQTRQDIWTRPTEPTNSTQANRTTLNKITGILNKLTLENFDILLVEIMAINVPSYEILDGAVLMIFNKAVNEVKFTPMYAILARELALIYPSFIENGTRQTFRRLLLNRCNTEIFVRPDSRDDEEYADRKKKRVLGTALFIGELFKVDLLPKFIVLGCAKKFLDFFPKSENPEFELELLHKLIVTASGQLESPDGHPLLDDIFSQIKRLQTDESLTPRIKFMMLDLSDLRANSWKPRSIESLKPGVRNKSAEDEEKLTQLRNRFPSRASPSPNKRRSIVTTTAPTAPPVPSWASTNSAPYVRSHRRVSSCGDWAPTSVSPPGNPDFVHAPFPTISPLSVGTVPESAMPSLLELDGDEEYHGDSDVALDSPVVQQVQEHQEQHPPSVLALTASSSSVPNATNSTEKQSVDILDRIDMLLQEYLVSLDLDNAIECVKELGTESQSQIISQSVVFILQRKEKDQATICRLLDSLYRANILCTEHFNTALQETVKNLPDLELDNPNAWRKVLSIVGWLASQQCIPFLFIVEVSLQCSQLLSTPTKSLHPGFIASVALCAILREKGQDVLVEMWNEAHLSMSNFLVSEGDNTAEVRDLWTSCGLNFLCK